MACSCTTNVELNISTPPTYLDPTHWFDTMNTIKLGDKGIFIAIDMLIVTRKHLNKHLEKQITTLQFANIMTTVHSSVQLKF